MTRTPRFEGCALLILAGGGGRRLGRGPKALVPLGGRPLIARAMDLRHQFAATRLVVADHADRIAALRPLAEETGVPIVVDRIAGGGAPAGLDAGLSACTEAWALALACDMPHVDEDVLERLFALRGDVDAVVPEAGGRRHPLHAFYRVAAARPVARSVAESGGSLMDLLDRLEVRTMDLGDAARSVSNVNTPEELEAAERSFVTPRPRRPRP